MLTFNENEARKADKTSSIIRETGKYVGTITRAEKLLSRNGVEGVGFSLKTRDGMTANYLDVYTVKANGDLLWGANLVQAVLGCLGLKSADEGPIVFEKWDNDVREMVKVDGKGYPALMNREIGFVLQRELGTNPNNNADTDKVVLVRVFQAATGLTSSEILDKQTKPAKLAEFMKTLAPVRDNRKKTAAEKMQAMSGGNPPADDFYNDDIKF